MSPTAKKAVKKDDEKDVKTVVKKAVKKDDEKDVKAVVKKAAKKAAKKALVVVESPAKATAIGRYLGSDFRVEASMGHIKDLPRNKLGVDVDNGFTPEYVAIKGKNKIIDKIKKAARTASAVYLAPDPDREGEAIAWHIASEIKNQDIVYRATFNEITKDAVRHAIDNPTRIDLRLFEAQQARRILDRLVGYKISPILWKKVGKGLSAGRVQSVAVRMICEREAEVVAFKPQEYWTLDALVHRAADAADDSRKNFRMRLGKLDGEKPAIDNEKDALAVRQEILDNDLSVTSVTRKEVKRNPAPCFITSTLQQEAARKLGFTAKRTMSVAQKLYEGMEVDGEAVGLITYMRTDSTRISDDAVTAVRKWIRDKFGKDFAPPKPRIYKTKKGAQDAHEAIRPTGMDRTPDSLKEILDRDQLRLYTLIWNRFVACQMSSAVFDRTQVQARAGERCILTASGQIQKFAGFLALYEEGRDDEDTPEEADPDRETMPDLKKGDALIVEDENLKANQHFTKPPPRFTEATLVKELESQGIGRPSTYAAIISLIQDKEYVRKDEQKRFAPTDLGKIINELLVEHFAKIMDVKFTALMEDQLDRVEDGEVNWETLISNFWHEFKVNLADAEVKMRNLRREVQKTDLKCEKCAGPMVIRWGKNGRFLACGNYPRCRNTKPYLEEGETGKDPYVKYANQKCPTCAGEMVIRMGKWGRFAACSNYPDCKTIEPIKTGVTCPNDGCGGDIVERTSKRGRVFYSCSNYPKCDFVSWERPTPRTCPQCKHPYLLQGRKGSNPYVKCPSADCDYFDSISSRGEDEKEEEAAEQE